MEEQASDSEEVSLKAQKLRDTVEEQKDKLDTMVSNLQETRKELELLRTSQKTLVSENNQIQRKFDNEHRHVLRLQQNVDDSKALIRSAQRENQTLQRELDQSKKRAYNIVRQLDLLEREKNMQVNKIHRSEQMVRQADEEAWHQEHTVLSLEKDLSAANDSIVALKKRIQNLDQLCEKYNNDSTEGKANLEKAYTDINVRDIEIQEMKKEISQWDSKYNDQVQVSNKLRTERGKAVRELIESQTENRKRKNKNNILISDMKTLRNELLSKEELLVKAHFDKKQETTQKEQFANELSMLKQYINEQDDIIQKQDLKVHRLNAALHQIDDDVLNQKKEYDQLINERDILSAQLIRRNDELALFYEKIKIQTNTLKTGELQYKERVEDLRHLKIKLQDTLRELDTLKRGSTDVSGVSRELIQREKELLQEKVKVKALSEELQNPLNVHRWRKLEGSDPATFELVQKNELLQKRLIKKTEEVIEKDAIIQEKEMEYLELKKQLAVKPGNEITVKLKTKENEIREKSRQMKAMAGELNMNQAQVIEYKKEIESLNSQLLDLKHKFFEQKKREMHSKEKELQWLAESGILCYDNINSHNEQKDKKNKPDSIEKSGHQITRFVGGGFAVK